MTEREPQIKTPPPGGSMAHLDRLKGREDESSTRFDMPPKAEPYRARKR